MRDDDLTTVVFRRDGHEELHVDHQGERVFLHVMAAGFSLCVSFNAAECEQLSRAFSKAAFLVDQHEASKPQPPMNVAA